MSGGARITSRLGCELAETIAAIAPVAGIQFLKDCKPKRPLPVITFHGRKDVVNPYALREKNPVYWTTGVEDSLTGWINNNGCTGNALEEIISERVTKLTWRNCKNGSDVVFYRIENGGHTWPGSSTVLTTPWAGETNQDINASELIWDFFEKHPLP